MNDIGAPAERFRFVGSGNTELREDGVWNKNVSIYFNDDNTDQGPDGRPDGNYFDDREVHGVDIFVPYESNMAQAIENIMSSGGVFSTMVEVEGSTEADSEEATTEGDGETDFPEALPQEEIAEADSEEGSAEVNSETDFPEALPQEETAEADSEEGSAEVNSEEYFPEATLPERDNESVDSSEDEGEIEEESEEVMKEENEGETIPDNTNFPVALPSGMQAHRGMEGQTLEDLVSQYNIDPVEFVNVNLEAGVIELSPVVAKSIREGDETHVSLWDLNLLVGPLVAGKDYIIPVPLHDRSRFEDDSNYKVSAVQTRSSVPAVDRAVKVIQANLPEIIKDFDLPPDIAAGIAQLALGVLQIESKNADFWNLNNRIEGVVDWASEHGIYQHVHGILGLSRFGVPARNNTVGATQVNPSIHFPEGSIGYEKYGVNRQSMIDDVGMAALATVLVFAQEYNDQIRGRDDEELQRDPIYYLGYTYQGGVPNEHQRMHISRGLAGTTTFYPPDHDTRIGRLTAYQMVQDFADEVGGVSAETHMYPWHIFEAGYKAPYRFHVEIA